jgi:hypothetical protein
MKLKQIAKVEPMTRLTVSVSESTMKLLEAYLERYTEVYGGPIEKSKLVEEMLREFMTSDKSFMKSMAKAEDKPAARQPSPKVSSSSDPIF